MSFQEKATVNSKAEKLMGLGGETEASGVIQTQKQGYLSKRPFGGNPTGEWKKRYFVLKDSFLFWYDKKVNIPFEKRPRGCLPLGGCSVFPMGKDGNDFVFEVTHSDFQGQSLVLKSEDKADVEDWIRVLSECRRATYENAILGNALVEKLQNAGTTLEKEKERALQEAQEKASMVGEVRDKKWELMKKHMELEERHASELSSSLAQTSQLKSEIDEVSRQTEEARKQKETEAQERAKREKELADALEKVKQLEESLKARQKANPNMANPEEFEKNMRTIRKFFDGEEA